MDELKLTLDVDRNWETITASSKMELLSEKKEGPIKEIKLRVLKDDNVLASSLFPA
jgi:hypothetical protein